MRDWPDVTAALSVVPPFTRPGKAGVIAHFAKLAARSPVPLVIYHVPHRTAQPLSAESLRRLGALPGVAGVRYAVSGFDSDTLNLMTDVPDHFAVLAGDDLFSSPILALGATGGIVGPRTSLLRSSWRWRRPGEPATSQPPRRSGAGWRGCPPRSSPSPTRPCSRGCCMPRVASRRPTSGSLLAASADSVGAAERSLALVIPTATGGVAA